MTRKASQPRLLPKTVLEPIGERDALNFDALATCYRCRCGNSTKTGIRLEAITCVKCGATMKAIS